jgi:ABC-type multidrug transport system fused ATPase/permease subunit
MIAHRLSTTRHCDRIFILEQGRLLDSGSYDELMERSAYFRQMVEASKDAPSA